MVTGNGCDILGLVSFPAKLAEKSLIPWEQEKVKNKFHDLLFVPVAAAVFAGFLSIAFIVLSSSDFSNKYVFYNLDIVANFHLNELSTINIVLICFSIVVLALLFGFFLLLGIIFAYKTFIINVLILNTALGVVGIVYFFKLKQWNLCVLLSLFIVAVLFIGWRLHFKIKFSTQIMKMGSKMMRHNFSIWVMYLVMLVTNTVGTILYFVIFFLTVNVLKDEKDPKVVYSVYLYLVFCGYYFTEVFENSVQVIVGIIFSKWYYQSKVNFLIALFEIYLKCFGSICLGSLFASIVSVSIELFQLLKPNEKASNIYIFKPIWWLINYSIIMLQKILKYFNEYAFSYMSIHGTGYIRSSSELFKIYNKRGYETLINDSIIKVVLRLYIVFTGLMAAIATYFLCQYYTDNTIDTNTLYAVMGISSMMSMQMSRMVALLVNAYVHVLFLCIVSQDTEAVRQTTGKLATTVN